MNRRPLFLLSTVESDSHMWNLVYLELLLKEQGIEVVNLGPCVPATTTLAALRSVRADALVVSSVNGHGLWQARKLRLAATQCWGEMRSARRKIPPFLIGGKLTVRESDNPSIVDELKAIGFAEVFVGDGAVDRFRSWLARFKQDFMNGIGSGPVDEEYRSGSMPIRFEQAAARPAH